MDLQYTQHKEINRIDFIHTPQINSIIVYHHNQEYRVLKLPILVPKMETIQVLQNVMRNTALSENELTRYLWNI